LFSVPGIEIYREERKDRQGSDLSKLPGELLAAGRLSVLGVLRGQKAVRASVEE
jgi:hypothetical protein